MKKITFILCLLFGLLSTYADEPELNYGTRIDFTCSIVNPSGIGNHIPRTPIQPPTVYLCDHTLYICGDYGNFSLQVLTDDETTVYSTYVTSGTTEVQLPSTLSGDYLLQLECCNYLFTGEISL